MITPEIVNPAISAASQSNWSRRRKLSGEEQREKSLA
jgi:hypothetical protein